MNESERNAEFPVHVDLGREMSDSPMVAESDSKEKGGKRKYYPTLYISDAPKELADIPDEGCVLIKYKRRRLSVGTDGDGKKDVSLDLEVQGICLPEDMKESAGGDDDGDGGMDSIVDDLAKKAGVIGKKEKSSDMPSVSAHDEDDKDDGY